MERKAILQRKAGRCRPAKLFLLAIIAIASLAGVARGGEQVYVGIYVNQIYDLSVKENSFVADFWIWFRWKDDNLKPLDSFKVVNCRETETIYVNQDPEKKNGYHYAQARLRANISKAFDIQQFPRDSHTLAIEIDDEHSVAEVQYVADVENCAFGKDVQVPGWRLEHPTASVSEYKNRSLYGAGAVTPTSNSRFQFAIDMVRPDWGGFIKLYLALFLSSMIAILSFKVAPGEIDARLALVLTALLGVMLNQFIALKGLPETTALTVTDKRHALGLLMVVIALVDTGWGKYMSHHGKAEFAARFDKIAFFAIVLLYVALNVLISL